MPTQPPSEQVDSPTETLSCEHWIVPGSLIAQKSVGSVHFDPLKIPVGRFQGRMDLEPSLDWNMRILPPENH
jgi:hypothetical protein